MVYDYHNSICDEPTTTQRRSHAMLFAFDIGADVVVLRVRFLLFDV